MTTKTKNNNNKVVIIAPKEDSKALYASHLNNIGGIGIQHFSSIETFRNEIKQGSSFVGYVVDLRALIKTSKENKEYFHLIIERHPVIRISHSPDMKTITGNINGKTLKDSELFEFFSDLLSVQEEDGSRQRIGLICKNPESMAVYSKSLSAYPNIQVSKYSAGRDLAREISQESRFNGFIIDLRTILKADGDDKDFFYELINSFPVIRISHSKDQKVVKGNFRNKNFEGKELFDYFLMDICNKVVPRGIRTRNRRGLFLSVNLKTMDMPKGVESIPTNTLNISEEGVFVITTRKVEKGSVFYITIKELTDQTPIRGMVKWTLPWGASVRHLPGFGGVFKDITAGQKAELTGFLRQAL